MPRRVEVEVSMTAVRGAALRLLLSILIAGVPGATTLISPLSTFAFSGGRGMSVGVARDTDAGAEWRCPECGAACTRPLRCLPCRHKSRRNRESRRESMRPKVPRYSHADNELIQQARSSREMAAILEGIRQAGRAPTVVQLSMAVSRLGKLREGKAAVELLHTMENEWGVAPNEYSYLAAIAAMEREGRWSASIELLRELETRGMTPNVRHLSSVISACAKGGGQIEVVMELMREMEVRAIDKNEFTYSAAISCCNKAGNTELALELLSEMKERGLVPNAITYSSAISACANPAWYQRALALLAEMPDPNIINYNACLSACEKAGQWESALALLEELKGRGLQPTVVTYSACISALAVSRRYKKALDLLEEAKHGGIKLDVVIYSAAISACARAGEVSHATALLEKMKRDPYVEPNVVAYTATIAACERSGHWEMALQLLDELKHSRTLEPDVVAYSATISALEKGGQWERALALLDEMSSTGQGGRRKSTRCGSDAGHDSSYDAAISAISYNAAISASAGKGRYGYVQAVGLLDEMEGDGLEPNLIAYNAVLEALPREQIGKAREVLKHAIARGHFNVWAYDGKFDLHLTNPNCVDGACPAAVARVLLYHTLMEFAEGAREIDAEGWAIVTGWGRGSGESGPVLPAACREFLRELEPPLEVVDGSNPGMLMVTGASIKEWVKRNGAIVPSPRHGKSSVGALLCGGAT